MPATNKYVGRTISDAFLDLIITEVCRFDPQKLLLLSTCLAAAHNEDLDLITGLLNSKKNLKSIKAMIDAHRLLSYLLSSAARAAASRAETLEKLCEHKSSSAPKETEKR